MISNMFSWLVQFDLVKSRSFSSFAVSQVAQGQARCVGSH